ADRCNVYMVNVGECTLDEGFVHREYVIDVIYLTWYGSPLFRGGPMFAADTAVLYNVVRSMKRFAANPHGDLGFWMPAPLLAKLAAEGKTFNAAGETRP